MEAEDENQDRTATGQGAEFLALVGRMRRLQKEWFRLKPEDRPPGLIGQCKEAERRVDGFLRGQTDAQGKLF